MRILKKFWTLPSNVPYYSQEYVSCYNGYWKLNDEAHKKLATCLLENRHIHPHRFKTWSWKCIISVFTFWTVLQNDEQTKLLNQFCIIFVLGFFFLAKPASNWLFEIVVYPPFYIINVIPQNFCICIQEPFPNCNTYINFYILFFCVKIWSVGLFMWIPDSGDVNFTHTPLKHSSY